VRIAELNQVAAKVPAGDVAVKVSGYPTGEYRYAPPTTTKDRDAFRRT
jgi:hypothetical protein